MIKQRSKVSHTQTSQSILNQWVASRTRHLPNFAHVLFAVHHLAPFHLHALPFAPNLHTANFPAQFAITSAS
jgi:hypothetical protein